MQGIKRHKGLKVREESKDNVSFRVQGTRSANKLSWEILGVGGIRNTGGNGNKEDNRAE